MRNGSLWSNVVFKKGVIFPPIWFQDLKFRIWGLTRVRQGCDKGDFSFIVISQLRRPIELKFSQVFVILCICLDTPTVKTKLWQLPIVYTVFKHPANDFYQIVCIKYRNESCTFWKGRLANPKEVLEIFPSLLSIKIIKLCWRMITIIWSREMFFGKARINQWRVWNINTNLWGNREIWMTLQIQEARRDEYQKEIRSLWWIIVDQSAPTPTQLIQHTLVCGCIKSQFY